MAIVVNDKTLTFWGLSRDIMYLESKPLVYCQLVEVRKWTAYLVVPLDAVSLAEEHDFAID